MSPETVTYLFSGIVILSGVGVASAVIRYRRHRARRRAGPWRRAPYLRVIAGGQRRAPRYWWPGRSASTFALAVVAVFGIVVADFLRTDPAERVTVTAPGRTGPMPAPGRILEGRVSHVRDGDTIEIGGLALRLADLDCAESGTSAGQRATRAVTALTRDAVLLCRLTGARTYDRWVAHCTLPDGRTVSQAMVDGGHCAHYRDGASRGFRVVPGLRD
jgi:endonuclease YncB( thermonuclease family)